MIRSGPIVVGVDGSNACIAALRWAANEARLTRARLVAVTCYTIPASIFVVPNYTEADYARDAQEILDTSVDKALSGVSDVEVERRLIQERTARALTDAARDAQLLVVGSHGHNAFPGMHLGSVASYCVHHAPCPVLVFRGKSTTHGTEPST